MSRTGPVTETELIAFHAGGTEDREVLAARIAADPEARARLSEWQRQDAALKALYDPVEREAVPDRLLAVLRDGPAPRRSRLPQVAALAAMLLVGGAGGYLLARLTPGAGPDAPLAEAALRAYSVYTVEAVHPVEVGADEEKHLSTWLSKRLGHPLAPPDFTALGFRLMGGRVVPFETGPAALLMYEDDMGRRITLLAAPGSAGGDTAFRFAESDRAQSFTWVDGDLSYAVTGDIPRDTLRAIAVAAYDQLI